MNFESIKQKLKSRTTIILFIIIMLSTALMIYMGAVNKPILNGDELGSYISANQSTGNRLKFWSRSWYDGRLYTDAYSVHPSERFGYGKVWTNQADDVHPPLWYVALHTICSFFPEQFSKWYALTINILCIPILIILVYKIVLLLSKKNEKLALITSFLYGISTGTIAIVLFLRMYTVMQLLCTLVFYLHLKLIQTEKMKWKDYFLIGIATFLGVMTHYYFLAFLFILAVCFCVFLLKNKRVKEVIWYCITMAITAAISIVVYPAMLKHIFGGYRGDETMNNLKGNLVGFIESLKTVSEAVLTDIFGNTTVGIVILVIISAYAIISCIIRFVRQNQTIEKKMGLAEDKIIETRILILLVVLIGYYLLIAKATPIRDFRYFAPVYPLIIIAVVLGLYQPLQRFIKNQWVVYILILLIGIIPTGAYIITETPMEASEAEIISEEYKDCDAILALHDPADGITNYLALSNYYQMSKYRMFYIIYETELDPLDDETLKNEDRLIVTIYKELNHDAIMKYLKDYTGLSNETYLYSGDEGDTETYLLD